MKVIGNEQERAILVSDLFELDQEFTASSVFDSVVNGDSNFFINLIRLKMTDVPEFRNSYQRINDFFNDIAVLLNISDKKEDKFFNSAYKKFKFDEVNGINLGFSKSHYGSAWGPKLRKQALNDAFDIIKKGSMQPEIFHLVSLFEENIGPDHICDMIATIILPDIIEYTKRINAESKLTQIRYPSISFHDGIARNPYKKNCDILLLPVDILQELPIAKNWDDIDRVVNENETIRNEMNEYIGTEWHKWASGQKKDYIKKNIFEDPEKCARVIEKYRKETSPLVDLSSDLDYFAEIVFQQIRKSGISFTIDTTDVKTVIQSTEEIINILKDWIEYNKGWDVVQSAPSAKREKIVQRLLHLGAKQYIQINNLDMSFEPNAGRGPSDFKVSRGNDITVGEIKLSSNSDYLYGYEIQLDQYAKAEGAQHQIYVFVDTGNPGRKKTLCEKHFARTSLGEEVPILVLIDSTIKNAAGSH